MIALATIGWVIIAAAGLLLAAGGGVTTLAGGMSDAPAEGEAMAHKGCITAVIGLVLIVIAVIKLI